MNHCIMKAQEVKPVGRRLIGYAHLFPKNRKTRRQKHRRADKRKTQFPNSISAYLPSVRR